MAIIAGEKVIWFVVRYLNQWVSGVRTALFVDEQDAIDFADDIADNEDISCITIECTLNNGVRMMLDDRRGTCVKVKRGTIL